MENTSAASTQLSSPLLRESSRHTLGQSILLHLLPGVPLVVGYFIFAAVLARFGLPNILALMLTTILVEVPVIWWLLIRLGRRESDGSVDWRALFPWRRSVPVWQILLVGLPLIVFSMLMIAGVGPAVEDVIRPTLFGWVPDWFVLRPDPAMFATMSRELALATWVLTLFGLALLGGVTQELYFRGFLLPRMNHHGSWAPALNALLFAVFHLTSPWSWPAFFVMVLPWAYVVRWKESVQLGLFIHVGMLLLQWLGMTLLLFGLVELPA